MGPNRTRHDGVAGGKRHLGPCTMLLLGLVGLTDVEARSRPTRPMGGDELGDSERLILDGLLGGDEESPGREPWRGDSEPHLEGIPLSLDQATPPAAAGTAAPQEGVRFEARFSDGLHLKGPEDEWSLHLGGRYLGHERIVFGQPDDSGYRTRQALVRLDAEGWKVFAFRITGDFTPVNGVPAARLHELYVQWLPDPAFKLTVGLVNMPDGVDRLMPLLFTEGIERPITASFQPSQEPGLRVGGSVAHGTFSYDAAVSDGKSDVVYSSTLDDSEPGQDQGTGHFSGKSYISAAVAPFAESPEDTLQGLQMRLFASTNFTSGVDLYSAYKVRSPDFGITWLSPTSAAKELFFEGHRILAGADPTWTVGPLLLRGEFLFRRDRVARPSTGVEKNLDVLAWSAVASWMLTGERQAVGRRVPPQDPVACSGGGWGAMDVHLRAAGAEFDKDALQALGTDLVKYTDRFSSAGVGINWWPLSNLRISLEGILEDYHRPIAVNPAKDTERSLSGLLMRFQIDF